MVEENKQARFDFRICGSCMSREGRHIIGGKSIWGTDHTSRIAQHHLSNMPSSLCAKRYFDPLEFVLCGRVMI